jgi:hypothetical protein
MVPGTWVPSLSLTKARGPGSAADGIAAGWETSVVGAEASVFSFFAQEESSRTAMDVESTSLSFMRVPLAASVYRAPFVLSAPAVVEQRRR